jgi:hypothetical protein
MMLISDHHRSLQADLHARFNYGHGGDAIECAEIAAEIGGTVLDYGCGQGHLSRLLPDVEEYDPAVAGKDAEPAKCDVVVCADVLEHIEPELLGNVLLHLYACTRKALVLVIATGPSQKIMADGRAAHLIVEGADWWKAKLSGLFEFKRFEDRSDEGRGLLLVCKPRVFEVPLLLPIVRVRSTSAVTDDLRNENVKHNSARISARLEICLPPHDRIAHLVCFGPSTRKTWPIAAMAKARGEDVFTVSGSHQFLIDRGVIPTAHMDCDPRPHKAFQLGEPHKDVEYWLASCVDPVYLDRLEGHTVKLWHSYNGIASRVAFQIDPGQKMIIGGGSIGLRAMSILYARGYRHIEIHGMDCSFDGGSHAANHLGKQQIAVSVKCGERWFDASGVMVSYARFFHKQLSMMSDCIINLHGDGLLQHMQKTGATNE